MRKIALIVSLLLIAACAETYRPAGTGMGILTGGGYREKQIDKTSWEIEYSGSDYDFVRNSAIRRAAEIAKQEGFPYFTAFTHPSTMSPNYTSGGRYVGSTVFLKVTMQGWPAYEARCKDGHQVVAKASRCDLYDTERTLASYSK